VKPWVDSSRETFLSLYGEPVLARLKRLRYDVCTEEDRRPVVNRPLSLEEYAANHKNDESVTVPHLPYWCPTCKQYVARGHDGPGGIDCEDYLDTLAEKRAVKLANSKKKSKTNRRVSEKHRRPRGRGPTGVNVTENRFIERLSKTTNTKAEPTLMKLLTLRDGVSPLMEKMFEVHDVIRRCENAPRYEDAFKRWLMEKKMVMTGHPNAPENGRSLEAILERSRLFPTAPQEGEL